MIKKTILSCLKSLYAFFYPPLCLHCDTPIKEITTLFCSNCSLTLDLLNPKLRCPFCFLESHEQNNTLSCLNKKQWLHRKGAVFEHFGPALSLLYGLKKKNQPFLAKSAAGFLAIQWHTLNWKKPDFIIPHPITPVQKMKQGYDHNFLIASHLSKILSIPTLSNISYNLENKLVINKKSKITDQTLLLIGDTLNEEMDMTAKFLVEQYPKQIFSLALCIYPQTIGNQKSDQNQRTA